MSAASLAKMAAEKQQLLAKVASLEAQVAAASKRSAAEAELLALANDPRTPLDMKPVDIEDFMSKRAELEQLEDLGVMRTAVKIASTRSFAVGSVAENMSTDTYQSSRQSKADREFENSFLSAE